MRRPELPREVKAVVGEIDGDDGAATTRWSRDNAAAMESLSTGVQFADDAEPYASAPIAIDLAGDEYVAGAVQSGGVCAHLGVCAGGGVCDGGGDADDWNAPL